MSENIDETPSGMLLHGIMSSIAEFYSQNLSTEIIKGTSKKVERGGFPGMAPLGYSNLQDFSGGNNCAGSRSIRSGLRTSHGPSRPMPPGTTRSASSPRRSTSVDCAPGGHPSVRSGRSARPTFKSCCARALLHRSLHLGRRRVPGHPRTAHDDRDVRCRPGPTDRQEHWPASARSITSTT